MLWAVTIAPFDVGILIAGLVKPKRVDLASLDCYRAISKKGLLFYHFFIYFENALAKCLLEAYPGKLYTTKNEIILIKVEGRMQLFLQRGGQYV